MKNPVCICKAESIYGDQFEGFPHSWDKVRELFSDPTCIYGTTEIHMPTEDVPDDLSGCVCKPGCKYCESVEKLLAPFSSLSHDQGEKFLLAARQNGMM
jgi:hypothetical protein